MRNMNKKYYKVIPDIRAIYNSNTSSESKIIQELKSYYPGITVNDVIGKLKEVGYRK